VLESKTIRTYRKIDEYLGVGKGWVSSHSTELFELKILQMKKIGRGRTVEANAYKLLKWYWGGGRDGRVREGGE